MSWDYIIVGAGSAGCVLAKRLGEAGHKVLLLEAGRGDTYHWVHIPMGYLYCIGNPRTDWLLHTTNQHRLNGRRLKYPRGKLLGGSSSINGMLYVRGQAADYDMWRQSGLMDWGWEDVLPYFKKSEDYVDGPSEMHGVGGEWRVDNQRLHWEVLDHWADAAAAWGLPRVTDFNTGNNEGVGYFRVNQRNGWRMNTAKAFLRTAKAPGLKVVTGAHTKRLIIEEGRAVGVEYHDRSGHPVAVRAQGEVILSAGAIGSPEILQRSGIGEPDHLKPLGIDIKRATSIGYGLQDHLQLRCVWRLKGAKTLNTLANSLWGKAQIGLEYAFKRTGPMSMAPSQLGAFARSSEMVDTPDLQYHVQPLSLDAFGEPLHDFPAITASVCNLRPRSRGHVLINSTDPYAKPVINPGYLEHPDDRRIAAQSIRQARAIMKQSPMQRYEPDEIRPGPVGDTNDALATAAGDIGTTIFHPTCTVRMGAQPNDPLDERFMCRGIAGLRVIDASAMPSITSGNTNAPTIMMAEKGADMILEDARR